MGKVIGMDLKAKKDRKRSDYVFHQDYRTRWYLASPHKHP